MTHDFSTAQLDTAVLRTRADHRMALAALRKVKHAYGHFVPKSFLNFLGKNDIASVELGDFVEMKTSIMFADIRNFTTMSEELKPEEIFRTLNAYLAQYEAPIHGHGGVIDKFLGDGALAIFKSADEAVAAGNEMLDRVRRFNRERRRQSLPTAEIGIGINTGYSALGVVGNAERLETTVIGDCVNVASRIQDLTKLYGSRLLISETTYLNLDDPSALAVRLVDRIQVKGRARPVSVYEVFDEDDEELASIKTAGLDLFEDGVSCFHLGYHKEAGDIFRRYDQVAKDDPVAKMYIDRCLAQQKVDKRSSTESANQEFLWRPAYDTGHPNIDDQHHHLVEIYENLRVAVRGGSQTATEEILVGLKEYSLEHFAEEARLMESTNYPLMAEHLHEHRQFVRRLELLSTTIRTGDRSTRTMIFWINIFLFDWLATHSSKIDRHLARYIARAGAA